MKRLLSLCAIYLAFGYASALEITISPGTLGDVLPTIDSGATSLYIKGEMDIRDLTALRDLPSNINTLSLMEATIIGYTGEVEAFPGRTHFKAGEMPDHLLFGCALESFTFPTSVSYMGKGICAESSLLREVTLPEGVEMISDYAFYGCPQLSTLRCPTSLKHLGVYSLAGCTVLETLNLSNTSITVIPERCLYNDSSLANLYLPDTLKEVGTEAFAGTSIKKLILPSIDHYAPFALSAMPELAEVSVNNTADIDMGLLMGNHKLNSVKGSPSYIPDLYLADSPVADLRNIVSSAETIGRYAFSRSAMETLTLASGLGYIDEGAFAYSTSLSEIDARPLGNGLPEVYPEAFSGLDCAGIILHVTADSESSWRAHPYWSLFNIKAETGVDSASAVDNDIQIRLSGGILSVEAPENISEIEIWQPDGSLLSKVAPRQCSYDLRLDLPEGTRIIIVRVNAGKLSRSASFMTR